MFVMMCEAQCFVVGGSIYQEGDIQDTARLLQAMLRPQCSASWNLVTSHLARKVLPFVVVRKLT